MPSNTNIKKNSGLERMARWAGRNPVGHAIGQVLYLLGFYAECKILMVARGLKSVGLFLGGILGWLFGGVLRSIGRFFAGLWRDITEPFRRFKHGMGSIRTVVKEERQKGGAAGRKALGYFGSGIKAYIHLVLNLLKLLLPLAAGAVFVFTVYTVLSMQYVLAVELNDEVVGYIADEETFEQARNMLRERIQAAGGLSSEDYVLTPSLTLATADSLTTKAQLVNNILLSQDNDDEWALREATGIYINGSLEFVTTDIETVEQLLAEMLDSHFDAADPDPTIDFVQTIEYEKNTEDLYFVASIMDTDTLLDTLTSVVAEEEIYTANGEENISEIARDHDISLTHLLAYNEGYVQSLEWDEDEDIDSEFVPEAGTALVVRPQQNYLQVRKTYTQWRIEELPYSTEYIESEALLEGITRVHTRGVPGMREKAYYVEVVDGIKTELPAEDIAEIVLEDPVTEVIQVGTGVRGAQGDGQLDGAYIWPVPDWTQSSRGYTGGHQAQDINAAFGATVVASNGGVVITSDWHWSYGWYIVIEHPDGIRTLYAHNQALYVSEGVEVSKNQAIAEVGSTGTSTGPHCHFEVIVDGVRQNPLNYVEMPPRNS